MSNKQSLASQSTGRLQDKYQKEISVKLKEEFGIKNRFQVPYLEKVVINLGIGEVGRNKEGMEGLKKDIALIAGQVPSVRPAKISIASFNVRRGMPVGLSVTLRQTRMYSFFDKLVSIVLPRLRDFRGVMAKSFDKYGNYTLSLAEHTIFPEIEAGKGTSPHSLEITMVIRKSDSAKSKRLLEFLGMPFEKGQI